MPNGIKIAIIAFFAALIFYGCSAENSKYVVKTLTIMPQSAVLAPLTVQAFTCRAVYNDGTTRDFSPEWSVSDSALGSITKQGIFTSTSSQSAEGFIRVLYSSVFATAEVSVRTAIIAPQTPQNLSASDIKPYSVSVSWNTLSANGYLISYGTDSSAQNIGTTESAGGTLQITGLNSNTTYYIKVCAFNVNAGNRILGPFSSAITFNTADYPRKFTISGNKILDDKGSEFVFRGVNILDPADMDLNYNKVNDDYFSNIAAWKAKIIRIPIHPAYYKYYGSAKYLALLDRVLDLAAKYKLYAIIDFHSIGFPPSTTYMDLEPAGMPFSGSIYAYTDQELMSFWSDIAGHYQFDSRVAFYEIFNEPTAESGATDSKSWQDWKIKSESIIDEIRAVDSDCKVIVGGINYAYDLEFAALNPVNRPNIVYATHPYPNESLSWDAAFGNLKSNYPIFATEFGFDPGAAPGIHYKADSQYGNDIINYLEAKKISWTVWNFSPIYDPKLLSDWNYNPTSSGLLFKTYLLNLN